MILFIGMITCNHVCLLYQVMSVLIMKERRMIFKLLVVNAKQNFSNDFVIFNNDVFNIETVTQAMTQLTDVLTKFMGNWIVGGNG